MANDASDGEKGLNLYNKEKGVVPYNGEKGVTRSGEKGVVTKKDQEKGLTTQGDTDKRVTKRQGGELVTQGKHERSLQKYQFSEENDEKKQFRQDVPKKKKRNWWKYLLIGAGLLGGGLLLYSMLGGKKTQEYMLADMKINGKEIMVKGITKDGDTVQYNANEVYRNSSSNDDPKMDSLADFRMVAKATTGMTGQDTASKVYAVAIQENVDHEGKYKDVAVFYTSDYANEQNGDRAYPVMTEGQMKDLRENVAEVLKNPREGYKIEAKIGLDKLTRK